jgi:hypothetical protein
VGLFGVYTALDSSAPSVRVAGDASERAVPSRLVVSEIPPSIRLTLPNLTVEEYKKLKRDSAFLLRTLRTCEGCFLVYAQVRERVWQGALWGRPWEARLGVRVRVRVPVLVRGGTRA